jgi:Polyketide cyclase / dehydrase and lipid transport
MAVKAGAALPGAIQRTGAAMIKTIVIVLVVVVAAILGYAATRPDIFTVQRAASIKAPPEKIFPLIDDFHRWPVWSPWEKMDPDMKRTYSGSAAGKGAAYAWQGNSKVGEGRMEILDDPAPSKVVIKLDFIKPFEGHNVATFLLVPRGDVTDVTWTMDGPSPFVAKLMGVFTNMDKMIGSDFEAGLANLKAAAEK